MPKGRKYRQTSGERIIRSFLKDAKQDCICLLNGLCICVSKQSPPADTTGGEIQSLIIPEKPFNNPALNGNNEYAGK